MALSLAHIQSLVLVAGLSGAGKSHALDTFEDSGFFTLDNLPVPLLRQLIELSQTSAGKYTKTALQLDIENRDRMQDLRNLIDELDPKREKVRLVFLDAKTETIIKRYSETRRPHPNFDGAKDKSLEETIQRERRRLSPLRESAHFVIDTSSMNVHELRRELISFIETLPAASARQMRINFLSFGFKFGIPIDCDLVVDVRFLPNPHFVESLRDKTGLDPNVANYVLNNEQATEFVKRYSELLTFLLPRYQFEGKSYLNIGIGCTGGKHRSVAIATALASKVVAPGSLISVKHRDAER
ncbi:MAG: RNase adapter RapZ [Oligoflexia bacterium]|nr:RNase adapter RapZ [Oligoflexia bacterium]